MNFDQNLGRLNLLRGQVNPSLRALEERAQASFKVDEGRKALWSLLPPNYFITHEILNEIDDLK